jgi:hypothetical protein
MPEEVSQTQSAVTPLTYEQEVHAMLWAAAAITGDLLLCFKAQAARETGEAKKLTEKCIQWREEDLRRIRALIPQALERRDLAVGEAGQVGEVSPLPAKGESFDMLLARFDRMMKELNGGQYVHFYTHIILPQLLRWQDAQPSPSALSQDLQIALRELSQVMGNPAIEFKVGEIEAGLVRFAAKRIRALAYPGPQAE